MLFKKLGKQPDLSIVVVGYAMPQQLANTVFSLSRAYQQNADACSYEVIVVENRSKQLSSRQELEAACPGLRYYRRREKHPTPVNAINFGLRRARGEHLAVMIDGARLLSPGVIYQTLQAFRLNPAAVVGVPGYHLGDKVQQESSLSGYDEHYEREMLHQAAWREDGYQLFSVSCPSQSCIKGAFAPLPETNWLAMSRRQFKAIGGFHQAFNSHGGGYANHDAWRRACDLPHSQPVILAGEGCFHQYHGGATTDGRGKDLKRILGEIEEQYRGIRGQRFAPSDKPAILLGKLAAQALPTLIASAELARNQS